MALVQRRDIPYPRPNTRIAAPVIARAASDARK